MASNVTIRLSPVQAEALMDHLMFPPNGSIEEVYLTVQFAMFCHYRDLTKLAKEALGAADDAALKETLELMCQSHPTADELAIS